MRFDYLRPASLGEATAFLAREAGAQPLAGGTDLFPRIKDRLISPKYVVSLKGLPELQGMGPGGGGWRLGALTTIRAVETSAQVRQLYPILSQAAGTLGSVQVRNVATVGGNLCHAVPSADMAPALLALDAQATLVGPQGKRSLPLEKFFLGPRLTALQPGELLMEVAWPPLPPRWGGVYLKLGHRQAMDLAIVGVAAVVALDAAGRCLDCRIALGAVAPTPVRCRHAEAILRGEKVTPSALERAGEIGMGECQPIDDMRASRRYRCDMVKVLTRRALGQALEQAQRQGQG